MVFSPHKKMFIYPIKNSIFSPLWKLNPPSIRIPLPHHKIHAHKKKPPFCSSHGQFYSWPTKKTHDSPIKTIHIVSHERQTITVRLSGRRSGGLTRKVAKYWESRKSAPRRAAPSRYRGGRKWRKQATADGMVSEGSSRCRMPTVVSCSRFRARMVCQTRSIHSSTPRRAHATRAPDF